MCLHAYKPHEFRWKRVLDLMEGELWEVVRLWTWVLGTEFGSSERAAGGALNHSHLSSSIIKQKCKELNYLAKKVIGAAYMTSTSPHVAEMG